MQGHAHADAVAPNPANAPDADAVAPNANNDSVPGFFIVITDYVVLHNSPSNRDQLLTVYPKVLYFICRYYHEIQFHMSSIYDLESRSFCNCAIDLHQ